MLFCRYASNETNAEFDVKLCFLTTRQQQQPTTNNQQSTINNQQSTTIYDQQQQSTTTTIDNRQCACRRGIDTVPGARQLLSRWLCN
jgi:hypothetical protein